MTSSIRSRLSRNNSSRGHADDPEERFAQRVTLLFIGLIAIVVAIIVAAFVYDYYNSHLKPVATVGGTSITRDQWSDRAKLEFFRLTTEEQTVREQLSAGTLSVEEGNARLTDIASAKNDVASTSIESLIDLTFKGQLAQKAGLAVTDADVDEAIMDESMSPEARKVSVIFVEPASLTATPEERQAAFTAAQAAATDLAAGKAFADVAKQYSTDASKDNGGDYGFVTADSTLDPAFIGALFALEEGGTTPVIKGADGVWRIGRVDQVRPGTMDSGLEQEIRDTVGWDLYRGQVRKEALAQSLDDSVVTDATSGDREQANVSEIVLEGDTSVPASEDEGKIRASHILYSPNDDPSGAQSLDPTDPAWATAQQEAETAAAQLRKVTDPAKRAISFGARAKSQSDDTVSGANGGDLGLFARGQMVPEFADPLFDTADLAAGDIVGPVKTAFGWHVIEFQERTPGLQERIDEVVAKLGADGATFADVARELSDGAEAPAGGDLGWLAATQLDEAAAAAIWALAAGAHTESIPLDDGYHFYQQVEKAMRPLDAGQRATIADTAFADWYDPQKEQATTDKVITRDPDIFSNAPTVGG